MFGRYSPSHKKKLESSKVKRAARSLYIANLIMMGFFLVSMFISFFNIVISFRKYDPPFFLNPILLRSNSFKFIVLSGWFYIQIIRKIYKNIIYDKSLVL